MKIEVFKNRMVYKEGVAGTQKENNFEIIDFKFPEELSSYKKYIEFDTQDGKFVDEIKNDSYSIERNITKYPKVVVQVVMKDLQNDIVFKSQLFNLFFNDSINASEELETENRGLLDTFELDLLEVQTTISNNSQEIDILKTRVQNIESEQITQNENIEDNTSARHTHGNKSVLDGISSQDIINWNNKAEASDIPDVSDYVQDSNYVHTDNNFTNTYKNRIDTIGDLNLSIVDGLLNIEYEEGEE